MDPLVATLAIALALALGVVLGFYLSQRTSERYWRLLETTQAQALLGEREAFRKTAALLKDCQDRITAKDLQGYMAIRETAPQQFGTRNDIDEAMLEARRNGILERQGVLADTLPE